MDNVKEKARLLREIGIPTLPVATGTKYPGYSGKKYLEWTEYQDKVLTEDELNEFFSDKDIGIGVFLGNQDCFCIVCIDLDTKEYIIEYYLAKGTSITDKPELRNGDWFIKVNGKEIKVTQEHYNEIRRRIDNHYQRIVDYLEPKNQIVATEETRSKGYHIYVKVKNHPNWTTFTNHTKGELRGKVFTVISPTIDYESLIDNWDRFNKVDHIEALDDNILRELGIVLKSKDKAKSDKNNSAKLTTNNVRDRALDEYDDCLDFIKKYDTTYDPNSSGKLLYVLDEKTNNLINGDYQDTDHSAIATAAIKEIIGANNFYIDNNFTHSDSVVDYIEKCFEVLEIDEDRAGRILKGILNQDYESFELSKKDKGYTDEKIMDIIKKRETKAMKELSREEKKATAERLVRDYCETSDPFDQSELLAKIKALKMSNLKNDKDIFNYYNKLQTQSTINIPLSYMDYATFLNDTPNERNYLIQKILEVGKTIIISSDAKVGKSTLKDDMLKALITRDKFLESYDTKPAKILLYNADEQNIDTKERHGKLGLCELGKDNIKIFREFTIKNIKRLEITLNALMNNDNFEVNLIIIDSLTSALNHDGINIMVEDEIYSALKNFVDFLNNRGISCIILHHNSKDKEQIGINKLIGSNAIGRIVDASYSLAPDKENKILFSCNGGRSQPKELLAKLTRNTDEEVKEYGYFFSVLPDDEQYKLNEDAHKSSKEPTVEENILKCFETSDEKLLAKDVIKYFKDNELNRTDETIQKTLSNLVQKNKLISIPHPTDHKCRLYSLPNESTDNFDTGKDIQDELTYYTADDTNSTAKEQILESLGQSTVIEDEFASETSVEQTVKS